MTGTARPLNFAAACFRHGGALAIVLMWACVYLMARADELPAAVDPKAYRRVFVPADNVPAWPRDGGKFLPVEARDFDAWIAAANRAAASEPAVRIVDAQYSARLEGNQLVDGQGRWQLVLRGPEPALLPLGQMALIVRDPAWLDQSDLAVRMGLWGERDLFGLQVPRSDTLAFTWHAHPADQTSGNLVFPLHLPPAARQRLTLDLPADMRPALDGSVVVDSEPLDAGDADSAPARRWTFAVGPSSTTRLRIESLPSQPTGSLPTTTLHERMTYHIGRRGLEIVAELTLDLAEGDPGRLSVKLPPEGHLLAAEVDGRALAWRLVADPLGGGGARAVAQLPSSPQVRQTKVILKAWAPLVADQRWTLPTLRPEGTFWSSGSMKITTGPLVELRDLALADCEQTGVTPAESAESLQETLNFTAYSPAGSLAVVVGSRRPNVSLRQGTTLEIGDAGITGRLVTQLAVDRGSLHALAADLQPGWTVDAVASEPAGALADWYVEQANESRQLRLRFAEAATVERPVRVVVSGHLHRSIASAPIPATTLRMLTWTDAHAASHLLLLQANKPYELEFLGRLPTLAAEDAADADRALFDDAATGRLVDLRAAAPDAAVRLATSRGAFEAAIQLDATLDGEQLRQTWHIACRPRGAGIDRLLAYFSQPLGEATGETLVWRAVDTHEPLAAERIPADDPRYGDLPDGGELWEVRLRRPFMRPVTIEATLSGQWTERDSVLLVALPEAADQEGHILVRTVGASGVELETSDLSAVPLPAEVAVDPSSAADGQMRAMFRYDPGPCIRGKSRPQLWLAPGASGQAEGRLLAEQVELESIYAGDGRVSHRAIYRLQNRGLSSVDLRLPPGAKIESARVDGRSIDWQASDKDPEQLSIPLPIDARRCRLTLSFRAEEAPLANGRVLTPPLPDRGLPLLAGTWTVWLPEEFTADGTPLEQVAPATDPPSGVALAGWHAYESAFVAAAPQPIRVTHPPTNAARSMALFLAAAIAGTWLGRHRATHFIVLVAAAAALRLLLPESLSPLATGALLGLLFSLVLRWTTRSHPREHVDTSWTRSRAVPAVATTTVLLLLLAVRPANAEPPAAGSAEARATRPTIHSVLVPVDAAGRPSDTKYFVSEEFLSMLLAHGIASAHGGDWLLHAASINGQLQQPTDQADVVPGSWSLTLDVETLARDTSIELPLVRGEAEWPPTASLDGIPVSLKWSDAGQRCTVDVAEPGRYQLSLSFQPRVTADADQSQVQLTIPPVPGARFQLSCPAQLIDCRVPGRNIVRTNGATADLVTSELMADDPLIVRWSRRQSPEATRVPSQVAELLWLQFTRAGVTLDAKYLLGEGDTPLGTLSIAAEEGWELVTDRTDAAIRSVDVEPGPLQTVRVQLSPEAAGAREVLLRFRLCDGQPLGRHRLPELGLAAPTPASRWIAVWSDSSLEIEAACDESSATATADEFLSAWGESPEAPQIVFANVRHLSSCDVAVRPRAATATISETLHVAAGRDALRLQYEAQVQPETESPSFRCQVAVPANLSVSTVAVHEAARDVPFRWSEVESEAGRRVNVFFARPVVGPYRLVLIGSVPVGPSDRCSVPRIAAEAAEPTAQRLVLYRDEDADVSLTGPSATAASREQPDEIPPREWSARQVSIHPLGGRTAAAAELVVTARPREEPAEAVAQSAAEQASRAAAPAEPRTGEAHIPKPAPVGPPRVRLVDTLGLVDAAGGQSIVSRFLLIPGGLAKCSLRLPENQQLIRIELDDEPALLERLENGEWLVRLGSPELPQLLEVITRSAGLLIPESRAIDFERPVLLAEGRPVPVELSLWSLAYPSTDGEPQVPDAALVSAEELHAVRFDRLVGAAEGATESVRRQPEPDGRNWLLRWTRRLAIARAESPRRTSPFSETTSSSQVPQSDERQFAEAANRMDVWLEQVQDLLADRELEAALGRAAASAPVDPSPVAAQAQSIYGLAAGGTSRLRVEFPSAGPTSGQKRAGGLLAILCVAGAAVWLARRPAAWDPLWRWPHAVGVLVGLACWAWLSPAWIGLGLVGGSLVLLMWRGWPARSVYAEGTTVLRSYRRP